MRQCQPTEQSAKKMMPIYVGEGFPYANNHQYRRIFAASNRDHCDKQRYYLDLAKSRGRIGSIASQQCLYQLSILCK